MVYSFDARSYYDAPSKSKKLRSVNDKDLMNKLCLCMDKHSVSPIPTGKFSDLRYDVNPYSPIYSHLVWQAGQYKRAGNYEEAIKCYIKIFDDAECFNTDIVRHLCKVLISDGELLFAFYWLGAAGNALEEKLGPYPDPNMPSVPWPPFQDATNLANACLALHETKDFESFCDYVGTISGRRYYVLTCDPTDIASQADEIVRVIKSNCGK